jgi:putative PEP-CTERM system TPR-repeat lipoprotein
MKCFNNTLVIALCLGVAACSPQKTSVEYIDSAKKLVEKSQDKNAIVQLKNAIRMDKENSEARILLGSLYLQTGDLSGAEKEFDKALELQGYNDLIISSLLKIYNIESRDDDILALIDELPEVSLDDRTKYLMYSSLAYTRLGKIEKATSAIAEASELSTDSIFIKFSQAYLHANKSENIDSLAILDEIIERDSTFIEAYLLKGQLLFLREDFPNAIKSFKSYEELLPNNMKVKLLLAHTHLKNKEFSETNLNLEYLLKRLPEHAFVNQLKGIVEYQLTNYKDALFYIEKAIQNGLDTDSNKAIAGLSSFQLKQYELSYRYLQALENTVPNTHPIKRILAIVQMELGYELESSDTILDMENITEGDENLLAKASFELLKNGQLNKAKTLIEDMSSIPNKGAQEITRIGMLKLSMKDLSGILDLEDALDIDPNLPIAKKAIATAYFENENYEAVLKLASKWIKEQPSNVDGYNLAAKTHLKLKQFEVAEKMLQQALLIKKDNAYSLFYFAGKEFEKTEYVSAIDKYNQILLNTPDNIPTLIQFYLANQANETTDNAITKLKESLIRNENNYIYAILMSQAYYHNQNYAENVEFLETFKNKNDIKTDMFWELLSASYLKLNDHNGALRTYSEWIDISPESPLARYKKMGLQSSLGNYSGALLTSKEANRALPKVNEFKLLEIYYLTLNKQYSVAQSSLDKLSLEQRDLPLMRGVKGEILMQAGKAELAIPYLLDLYKVDSSPRNTTLLYRAFERLNRDEESYQFLLAHIKAHPNDNSSKYILANKAMEKDGALALKYYYELLESSPENYVIINNTAWLELQRKEYSTAEELILRAIKLQPGQINILDTYAQIKLEQGDKKSALKILEELVLKAPNNEAIKAKYKAALGSN